MGIRINVFEKVISYDADCDLLTEIEFQKVNGDLLAKRNSTYDSYNSSEFTSANISFSQNVGVL